MRASTKANSDAHRWCCSAEFSDSVDQEDAVDDTEDTDDVRDRIGVEVGGDGRRGCGGTTAGGFGTAPRGSAVGRDVDAAVGGG